MLSKDHRTLANLRPCCGPRSAVLRLAALAAIAAGFLVIQGGEHPSAELGGASESSGSEHAVDTAALAETQAEEGGGHTYSPYLVDVHGAADFDLISFKDVGLNLEDPEAYELLADALAMSLADHPAMSVDASLLHDARYIDAAYHVACGESHIYVDVWRADGPARWGYSLWSGCGEDSQFAWEELAMTIPIEPDVALAIQPLTDAIASSIGEAVATGCYERRC
jgi:hypothetical protein